MIKIENIIEHNNTSVCKGKLVFILNEKILTEQDFHDWALIMLERPYYIEHNMVDETEKIINPVIISETEEVEADDIIAHNEYGIGKAISKKGTGKYWICEFDGKTETVIGAFKILALPENFSHEHKEDIINGKLKDGDDVLVECEVHEEWLKDNPPFAGPYHRSELYYQIKLSEGNHITIFTSIKEPSNPNNYPTRCYCGHTTWCECVPEESWDDIIKQSGFMSEYVDRLHLLNWLKENYNPPKKKHK